MHSKFLSAKAVGSSVVATVFCCSSAYAQSNLPATGRTISPELEEIIVTQRSLETTLPLELSRYGSDLQIITAEQLRNHGITDVLQALELLAPGVTLSSRHGAFSYPELSLHGSRASDVLWTVDGVRLNNRLFNGAGELDTVPASMVERTEILKGGHGLMYGTQAIAGVVNLVTRSFSDTPGGGVTLGTGSHGLLSLSAYGRGAVGDHKFVAWASKDENDGYVTYDRYRSTATDRRRSYDLMNFGLKYGYDFTPDLSLTLMGIHTQGDMGHTSIASNAFNERDEDVYSARLDYTPASGPQYFLKGYYHSWDSHITLPGVFRDYWGYNDFGVNAATLLRPHEQFEYHLGYDFQTYKGRDDSLLIAGEREDVHAVFTQIRSTDAISEDARFAAGVRYNKTGGNDATVWNVSGVYDINDYVYVQGIVATAFMLPSHENLYRIHCPPTASVCTHGNPNLEPEKSLSFNLSVGGDLEILSGLPWHWQVTGWNRRVDNLITTDLIPPNHPNPPPPEFERTFVNVSDEVKTTGGEVFLRGPINDTLAFDVSYTYNRQINPNTGRQFDRRPRRSHKGTLSYSPPNFPLGLDLAYKYMGSTGTQISVAGEPTFIEHGDYFVFNVGTRVLFGDAQQHRLNARVENVLDETYTTLPGYDGVEGFRWNRLGPPRTLYVNYSYTF